ncbi:MAG: type II secretion system protein GspC [Candidatus Binatia bacterium]|nr:type II secretion system protein GspC [Candidatus Binatia bacterium]
MITRIARPYWVAGRLLLLGLAALFVATAISSVVRGRLSRAGIERGASASAPTREAKTDPLSAYLPIARRDLFAAVRDEEPNRRRTTQAQAGPADLKLLGTGGAGDFRFGIVEDQKAKEQKLVRLGDGLDGAEVVEVGWRRIVLQRGAKEEVLTVPPDLGVSASANKTRTRAGSSASKKAAESKVRKLGDDRFMIGRAEVDHQLDNLSTLFTQMRAVPSMKDGNTQGFRVFAIRRGSLFQQLGLRNNDVVQRINGTELTDPTRAMGLFGELKGENRLTVDVLRGGEPRTLSYEIR